MAQNPKNLLLQAAHSFQQNKFHEVISLTKKAAKLKPSSHEAFVLLSQAQSKLGDYESATKSLQNGLKKHPKEPTLHRYLASALEHTNKWDLAEIHYKTAIKLGDSSVSLLLLALCLQKREKWSDSIDYLDNFLKNGGDCYQGNLRLTAAKYGLHQYAEAQKALEIAMNTQPATQEAKYYQAMILDKTGKKDEARQIFEQLISNNFEPAKLSLGLLQFTEGKWEAAYKLYENRTHNQILQKKLISLDFPLWQGQPLNEKRILICEEQGLGDQIRYLFFLHPLCEEAQEVFIICDPRLHPLILRTFTNVKCLPEKHPHKQTLTNLKLDYCISMASLGLRYFSYHQSEKRPRKILNEDPQQVQFWQQIFSPYRKRVIGVCWRSVKKMTNRSEWYLSLDNLVELLKPMNVLLVNLQHGAEDEELDYLKANGLSIFDPRTEGVDLKDDLDKLAALSVAVDAVVSPATAICELAASVNTAAYVFTIEGIRWFFSQGYLNGFYSSLHTLPKLMGTSWEQSIQSLSLTLSEQLK